MRANSKLGVLLVLISGLLWVAVLAVPFLAVTVATKAAIVTSLIVTSEVAFWLGILLAGKELAQRYRRMLNPYYWWQRVTNRH
ncbi:transporter suffix domain-containing protein [Chamaesiphon sp. VAR_69_metabat_338]|uniref:transporter suffix domain-containing protein n=1 Tax=Chamaesiphon sp. VAR_69_metabat_338 TaxID=2964704 RepID=UPI00286D6DA7|nr:transporter suffix domain-containing protein [Chamaesiphon sp. VAR_69_metabat_338]